VTAGQPILVFGDDGSLGADRAWLWINQQRWPGWHLDIVTCHLPPFGPPIDDDRALPHPWSPHDARAASRSAGFTSQEHLVADSDPRIVLTDTDEAALVVIGQKGHGALKALHLGSTAEYVTQHLAAPTVIAKTNTPVRNVLVATDGSDHARAAEDALASMPWLDQIHSLTVTASRAGDVGHDIADAVNSTTARLAALPGLTTTPRTHLHDTKASTAILDDAASLTADLIVLGTRGHSRLKRRVLWGSTARAVIKTTSASVLIAHAPELR